MDSQNTPKRQKKVLKKPCTIKEALKQFYDAYLFTHKDDCVDYSKHEAYRELERLADEKSK